MNGLRQKKKINRIRSQQKSLRSNKIYAYNTINPIQYTTYYFYFSRLHNARLYFILIREKKNLVFSNMIDVGLAFFNP